MGIEFGVDDDVVVVVVDCIREPKLKRWLPRDLDEKNGFKRSLVGEEG